MRSRSTPPRPPAPGASQPAAASAGVAERVGRRARATRPNIYSAAARRARRSAELSRAVTPAELEPAVQSLTPLAPEELYRREKARRAAQADAGVMAEARRILAEQMAESGKKRGVTITPRGRPPKPKPRPDDWDLEEFGEAQLLGRSGGVAVEEE